MQMPEETSPQIKNRRAAKALAETKKLPPQTAVEVRRGVTVRRTKGMEFLFGIFSTRPIPNAIPS